MSGYRFDQVGRAGKYLTRFLIRCCVSGDAIASALRLKNRDGSFRFTLHRNGGVIGTFEGPDEEQLRDQALNAAAAADETAQLQGRRPRYQRAPA